MIDRLFLIVLDIVAVDFSFFKVILASKKVSSYRLIIVLELFFK